MIREHWREPRFWRWFWDNRTSLGTKVALSLCAAAAFLVGGYFAADSLGTASAGVSAATYETTIQVPVTVTLHGKVVVRRIPVVRRILVHGHTAVETRYDTQVITTPGQVRLVHEKVVKYVPVIRRHVVTVNGKTHTTIETKLVPVTTIRTQTLTNQVTNQVTNLVTNQETVVTTVTIVNNRTVTETQTSTVVETQTLPPITVTETVPSTVTETITLPATTN